MPDSHREKPLILRLGAERQRLEDYARDTGQPVRRVITRAVKDWLDRHSAPLNTETTEERRDASAD